MAIATIGAIVLGEYQEAVGVMLFYLVGTFFESYAAGGITVNYLNSISSRKIKQFKAREWLDAKNLSYTS